MIPHRRIIVTGTARSGTLYTARLLAKIGLRAVHERVYDYASDPNAPDFATISERWRGKDVEVSWMAAPYLRHEPLTTIIWHQTRDPLKIVQCFHSHKMLDDPRAFAMELVRKTMPEVWGAESELAKAVRHVAKWSRLVEAQRGRLPIIRYRVEDLDPAKLRWLLKASSIDEYALKGETIEEAFAGMPKNVNACVGHVPVDWGQIKATADGPELAAAAKRWGYETC